MITALAFVATPVTDIPRARRFYEGVLGLKPTMEVGDGRWIEYDLRDGTFAITNVSPDWTASSQGTCAAFEVDDLQAVMSEIKASGASIYMDVFESPSCFMAVVCDPDGNKLVIHKHK